MKQALNINFAQGLETKTDPFQIQMGKFLVLQNSIFTEGGRLTKRNGYKQLPIYSASYLTTFQDSLVAVGSIFGVLSSSLNEFVDQGNFQPLELSVTSLVRSNTNQSWADNAIAPNGLMCTVYTDQTQNNLSVPDYKYVIADSSTGQNVVEPTIISANATYGTPRVFVLGNYFIIIYTNLVTSTYVLTYLAISTSNPSNVTGPSGIHSYTPATTVAFDGAVYNNKLYLAWNAASGAGIQMCTITSVLVVSSIISIDTHVATMVSVTVDQANAYIWVSYWNAGTSIGYVTALAPNLATILNPTSFVTSITVLNITSSAYGGNNYVYLEVSNSYGYDSSIATNYIQEIVVNVVNGPNSGVTIMRGVGLASKSFILDNQVYFLVAYSSTFQPTYFLANSNGQVIAKLAYENGGGYLKTGLPSVSIYGSVASIPYLYKDLIESIAPANASFTSTVGGIYSQTGINLAQFDMGSPSICFAEIGENLNLSGGFLWAYDGYALTEQGFHLYPDSVEVTTKSSALTPTGTTTSGSNVITAVSDTSSVGIGMTVTGTGIPANQVVVAFNVNSITFGPLVATGSHSAETITLGGNIATGIEAWYVFTYEWTDNQGNAFRSAPSIPISVTTSENSSYNVLNIPTLRLTYKIANPVKIVGYRYTIANPAYYQFTSIQYPKLNNVLIDSVTIVDALADGAITGNDIIYTSGGVVEDIGGPSFSNTFLFDDRLWGITSEDPNLLWFSKQVIENTPVEMSDLLTYYVAPTIGAQGSTGPLLCGAAMDDKLCLFNASGIKYINGTGPDNTGANSQYSQPIFITSTVGCSNQDSIVFMPQGLMFQFTSKSGNQIWLLGRDLSTQFIGAAVQGITENATIQSAVNIPGVNQVRFTLSSGVILVYDYYYQQWSTFTGIPAVSSTIYEGLHTLINAQGQIYQENQGSFLDGSNPVLIGFTTGWINQQGLRGYERIHEFSFLGVYYSPHKLAIQVAFDYEAPSQSCIYSPPNYAPPYGSDPLFGDSSVYGGSSNIESFRVFAKTQKCKAFQIQVQEIFDPSFGTQAGQGLSLSGINLVVSLKKGWAPVSARNSTG